MRHSFNGSYEVTRPFGVKDPAYANYPNSAHPGTDYGIPANTPLVAGMSGLVTVIDRATNVHVGRGKEVVISSGPYARHTCHMNRIDVKTGQKITEGQPLGLSGYTGYVVDSQGNVGTPGGAHLHDELKINGVYVDLEKYLKGADVNKFTPAQINQLFVIAFNRQANGAEKKRLGAMTANEVLTELDNNNRTFRGKAAEYDKLKAEFDKLKAQDTDTLWNKVKAAFGK